MTQPAITVLSLPPTPDELRDLAALHVDAVHAGAAVSFVLPFTQQQATQWWQQTLERSRPTVLVARDGAQSGAGHGARIVGTVQLQRAWAPNQPHRAEVGKLLVHRDHQRHGLGAALMHAVEAEAKRLGLRLLVLDAKGGGAAERLYLRLGWQRVGVIPRFAYDPDGVTLHDTVVFYKEL